MVQARMRQNSPQIQSSTRLAHQNHPRNHKSRLRKTRTAAQIILSQGSQVIETSAPAINTCLRKLHGGMNERQLKRRAVTKSVKHRAVR
eukprot:6213871-Pleurochrysis_carterae.AAC.1